MSMNIHNGQPPRSALEHFSFLVTAKVFLAPLLAAEIVGYFHGLAWGLVVIGFVVWSDLLLRLAAVNFRGRRKKDKVMAPLVEKGFTGHAPDPVLGWTLAPNETHTNWFAIPRKKLRHEYTVTTDDTGRRITSATAAEDRPVISFYGCSNTFGWGVDDRATYPWLVQEERSDHLVHNYGVSGYSLYQALLRMEQTIEQDRPEVVILGFSPGLEARSVSDHHYLRTLAEQGGTAPSCVSLEGREGKRVLKRFEPEAYKHLPLSDKSPLVRLVERWLNRVRYARRARGDARRKTTEHLLLAMDNLCRKHGAVFHVQYLVANTGYRRFLRETDINWAPGPVDLDQCDDRGVYRYRLDPFDGHPNADAHRAYARALGPVIDDLLATGKHTPDPGALGTTPRDEATESAIYPVF